MSAKKRILRVIAKRYNYNPDDVLIALWDDEVRFDYLKNEHSVVRKKDERLVESIILSLINKKEIERSQKKDKQRKQSHQNYNFTSVGKIVSPIQYLTKEEVLKIHEELVADFMDYEDPIYPFGLKNEHLLDSALFHPQTSGFGKIKYPTIESSGAALMYAISSNHPFHNGNKRTAMVALLVFLDKHNICLSCDENELFKISIKVADHKLVSDEIVISDSEIYELSRWICENSRKLSKTGERPISLKKLRQILNHFGCVIQDNGQIKRLKKVSFLGIARNKELITKKHIKSSISDGDEIDKGLIKSIREDLELDQANAIDSESFYAKANFTSSEFIIKYKNLLRRLART